MKVCFFLASANKPAYSNLTSYKQENSPNLEELELLEVVLNVFVQKVKVPSPWAFFASSALIFGEPEIIPQNEATLQKPIEEYAVRKVKASKMFVDTLTVLGIPHCVGILYPHESEYRKTDFIFSRLILAAKAKSKIIISDSSFKREWNDAFEFVDAYISLRDAEFTGSVCIGSGKSHSIDEVGEYIFCKMNLVWNDMKIERALDITHRSRNLVCDNSLLTKIIEWSPSGDYTKLVDRVIETGIRNG